MGPPSASPIPCAMDEGREVIAVECPGRPDRGRCEDLDLGAREPLDHRVVTEHIALFDQAPRARPRKKRI